MKAVIGLVSGSLLLLSGLRSLGLDSLGSLLVSVFLGLLEGGSLGGGVWVQSIHECLVLQRILSGLVVDSDGVSDVSEFGLNLIGVDDSREIGTGHLWSGKSISRFLC